MPIPAVLQRQLLCSVSLAVVVTAAMAATAVGQEDPPSTLKPPGPLPPVLQEGALRRDAWILWDERGYTTVVPQLSWERWRQLELLESGELRPNDQYHVEEIAVTGTVDRAVAELEVEMQIQVDPSPTGWTAVPLAMSGWHRRAEPELEGAARWRVELDEDGGYRLWVHAEASSEVTFRSKYFARVAVDANPQRLDLRLPKANTRIALDVPLSDVTARVEGIGSEDVEVEPIAGGARSLLRIAAYGGDFAIRWQQRRVVSDSQQVLEARSRWTVAWPDQQDRLAVSIEMDVQNLRGEVGPFEVQLPSEALLRRETFNENPDIEFTQRGTTEGGVRWQVVPKSEPLPEKVDLRFDLELPIEGVGAANPLQLPPINVVGAVRQTGRIAVEVDRPFRLRWQEGALVRAVELEPEELSRSARIYAFQFSRVPFDLRMYLDVPQEQVRLEPRYRVTVGRDQLDLRMEVHGSASRLLGQPVTIDLQGWTVESVGEEDGSLSVSEFESRDGQLRIEPSALLPSDRIGEEVNHFRLRIDAEMRRSDEDRSVEFVLPRLEEFPPGVASSALIEPGRLELVADRGVSLAADAVALEGLERRSIAAEEDGEAATYVIAPTATSVRFVGYLIDRPLEVSAETRLRVVATEHDATLIETLELEIGADRLDEVALRPPPDERVGDWEVAVDGRPAVLGETDEGSWRLVPETPLERGAHEVVFRRTVPLPDAEGASRALAIPVIRPLLPGGELRAEVPVELEAGEGWSLGLATGATVVSDSERTVLAELPADVLALQLSEVEPSPTRTLVDRLWLQTVVGESTQLDRAVMRIAEAPTQLVLDGVRLPESARIRALVSGRPASVARFRDSSAPERSDRLQVEVGETDEPVTVELSVWAPAPSRRWVRRTESRLGGLTAGARAVRWQLVLPRDEHLIGAPPDLASDSPWRWNGWRLCRTPEFDDRELAGWAGGRESGPPMAGNRYLFDAASVSTLEAESLERGWLWGLVAAIVLAVASCLTYVPRLRSPLVLVAAAVGLLGVAWVRPDLALLGGQLVIAASGLVLLMLAMRSLVSRRRRSTVFAGPQGRSEGSTRASTPTPSEIPSTRAADLELQSVGESSR